MKIHFTGIDIHDHKDMYLADAAMKYLIKNKKIKDMIT